MPVLAEYYRQLEQARGLPAGYLAKTRAVESANGTNLVNPNSSARGDFQFLKGTARQFGLTNPMDPLASATAAADLAAQNQRALIRGGITNPTGGDLYAAHQQGAGGYLKLAAGQSSGNAEMALNGGAGMAPGGFLSSIKAKFDRAVPANIGEAPMNAGQGPTVARADAMAARQPIEGAQGPSMPDPAAQAAPAAAPQAYKGGLLGMLGGGDATAPGADKSMLDKLGDMSAGPGGGAIGGLLKGIGTLAAPAPAAQAPVIQPPADGGVNVPNASLMGFLDPRRRRAAAMGAV